MKKNQVIIKRRKYFYRIKVYNTILDLPLFEVTPGVKIALFNILGETKLIRKLAKALAKKIPKNVEVIVTPEVKSICLAYELSHQLKVPYIVVRKTLKPYMINSIGEEVVTITAGKPQSIWLDGKDKDLIKNKNILLLDDVISTGSTLEGLRKLMKKAKTHVVAESAVFTEGDPEKWSKIIALGHLPVFKD